MKKIMSVTIDESLISWLNTYSQTSTKYRNKSHLVEVALEKLKEEEDNVKGEKKNGGKKSREERMRFFTR